MITLYQFRHSAFCLKTRMALKAKKLIYRVEEVKPGIGQIEIFQISGQKQLPIIIDDNNQIISDSSNICEYIDKKNSNNKLFPEDPILFAQSKLIEDWADTTMASLCKKALIKSAFDNPKLREALLPDDIPSSIKGIIDNIPFKNLNNISNLFLSDKSNIEFQKILESLSKALLNKNFLIGNSLSIADISVASQLSLLKFPNSSGSSLSGEGCQEFINNPYLENLFQWRDNIEEKIFSASSQNV
tara:strand:+ start:112 stop:843 length:732 start_codon:yes stop_codon:yes gene_type:complete